MFLVEFFFVGLFVPFANSNYEETFLGSIYFVRIFGFLDFWISWTILL